MIQARDALDTLERLSFQSQWSGVREMIAWERLYLPGAAAMRRVSMRCCST